MTIPTTKQAYTLGSGTGKISSFIFSDHDPSSTNFNHDLYTGWVNTQTKGLWYLEGINYSGGAASAQWRCVAPNIVSDTDPTSADYLYPVGQVWVNQLTGSYWALVNIFENSATWEDLAAGGGGTGILTITPNIGDVVGADSSNNINIIGEDGVLVTGGIASANTLIIAMDANAPFFTRVNTQAFFSAGTYTPTEGMKYCVIECVGGGGGGGGGTTNTAGSIYTIAGAGGGGGGYARGLYSSSVIGASQAVSVGVGGTAGSGSGLVPGGTGGTSSVGSLISATGGFGGNAAGLQSLTLTAGGYAIGGNGGIATSSQGITVQGSIGSYGISYGTGSDITAIGGGGGSSYFSGSSSPSYSNHTYGSDVSIGATGLNYGGGGSGGAAVSTLGDQACSGGVGGDGYVLITEYI